MLGQQRQGQRAPRARPCACSASPVACVLAASWFPGTGLSVNGCPVGKRESGAERWWLVYTAMCPRISMVPSPGLVAEGASGTKQGRNELLNLSSPCCFPGSADRPSPPFPGPRTPAWPQVRASIEGLVLGADLLLSDSLHPRILLLCGITRLPLAKNKSDSHWLRSLQH